MDKLKELEKSDQYMFHGSSNPSIQRLETRQAKSFMKLDGAPAVFASDVVEPPIFMAVLGSRRLGGWGLKGAEGFGFYIAQSDWDKAQRENWQGFVYVLNREGFVREDRWEWCSELSQSALMTIKVSMTDLPSAIQILSDDDYMAIIRQAR